MDVTKLTYNPKRIESLYTVMEDRSVVANRSFEVHIPKRFTENGMAEVTDVVTSVVVLGLVIPGECYGTLIALMACTMIPSGMREIGIDGEKYLILEIEKGDTFIENLSVTKDPDMPYHYFMEFNVYSRLPWYVQPKMLTSLYDNAKIDLGKAVGSSPQVMRVFNAMQFRDPDNLDIPYRNSKAMLDGRPPVIVGLNNSSMLIDGTFSKLLGGYLSDNILAAIINPDSRTTDFEKVIKGIPE
ncbi:hypothetical protein RISINGSUN_234 [Erwinia phage vB_EamM_RisingSun]|uniref:Uncharacterized protein n=1 Tax=Erwinia phage vB_EamM_RisingSun TaxID=2026080 RepID=A0A223LIS5_9CAUD|nr:virion structural protein [Erwinia phage vB_EamM_RisingSun]ASU03436.1 hypothetical protein RISINGSUN_234 [Erwinia phage vB_EamM_RisingSun]